MVGFQRVLALNYDIDEAFDERCYLDGNYLCTISHAETDRWTINPHLGHKKYRLVVTWPRDGRKEYWTLTLKVDAVGQCREHPSGMKFVARFLYDDKMVITTVLGTKQLLCQLAAFR